jgi:hypothetical protein
MGRAHAENAFNSEVAMTPQYRRRWAGGAGPGSPGKALAPARPTPRLPATSL